MNYKTHILNRVLPMSLRTRLRRAALSTIPSMRHLDMGKRLTHMRWLGFTPRAILDVGAGRGEWARMAAGIWPSASIYGFEPNRAEHDELERTRREISMFNYRHAFLGPRKASVAYQDAGHGTSLLNEADSHDGAAKADVLVLDELIQAGEVPQPQLIKLDVQGYELQVLEGAPNTLSQCEAVLMEVNFFQFHPGMPLADEVIAYMKQRGFQWYDVMGILRRFKDDALGQMDLMFVRTGHFLRKSNEFGSAPA